LKRLFLAVLLAVCLPTIVGARQRVQGFCETGGQIVVLAGLSGTPDVMGSYPLCTVNVFFAGLSGTVPISSISRSGGVVTVVTTSSIQNVIIGATVVVAGVTDTTYNGTFIVATINLTTNTFTYSQAGANSSSSGGTVKFIPNIFSDNVGTPLGNPFSGSITGQWFFYVDNSRYDVQISGGGLPSPVTFGDIIVNDVSQAVSSLNCPNPALTGFIRMCSTDQVCWRNNAGTADLCINKNASDQLFFSTNPFAFLNVVQTWTAQQTFNAGIVTNFVTSSSPTPALTGFLRLASNVDAIEWRNNANTGDVGLSKNASDILVYGATNGGIQAGFFQTASATPALTGTLRLASNVDAIEWRNNANTTDVGLSKNNLDFLNYGGAGIQTAIFQSTSANVAQSGVFRLASADFLSFRNGSNSNDVIFSQITSAPGNLPNPTFALTQLSQPATFWGFPLIASQGAAPLVSLTGSLRFATADTIVWRNNAGSGDVALSKSAADNLVFPNGLSLGGGTVLPTTNQQGAADTKILMAGTVSGTGSVLCTDANGGATTSGCSVPTGATKIQALIITSGICTTGGAETKCTSGPYSWPVAFADASYAVTCSAANPTGSGTNPGMYGPYPTTQTASQISVIIQSGSASAAGSVTTATIWCIGVHP